MPAIAAAALLLVAPSTALALGITSSVYFFAAIEAVSIVGSYLAYQSAKGKGRMGDMVGAGALVNTRSAEEVLPVLYGRHRVGGNQVYVHATGENNKYLHIIQTLSEGPIESIEQIYLDDKPASEYGNLVYYEFFNGSGTQDVCWTLKGADSDWDDYMRWTSYLYIRLEYNGEKFTGLPRVTVVAKGRKLYDPRSGVTAYSNNPALVVYDFLTSKRYGLGLDTSLVDAQSIMDAANWYESQPVPYTFNGVVGQRQAFLDNLIDILLNCRSDIIWSGGQYKLLVRKYDTPVMSLTEDDIIADSFTLSVPGLADTPNRVIVKYPDESQTDYPAWIASSYYSVGDKISPTAANGYYYECIDAGTTGGTEPSWPKKFKAEKTDGSVIWRAWPADLGWAGKDQVIEDTDAVLLYDSEERDLELQLIGTTNAEQANLLGIYNLERSRLNKAYAFTAHPRCLALEPGDMIQVTHSLVGWEARAVRVMDVRLSQDGVVGLSVLEEDTALYDDTLNLSTHTYFRTNLPDPLEPVGEATGVSFNEEEYFNKDVSYTRLKATFTQPTSPFWDYSEVWVNVDNAGYNHYTDARGAFTIEPVKEGVNYKVKLLSVSIQGVRQDISTATEWSNNIIGKNVPPDDVQNFRAIPQSDSVILMWDPVNIVDLQGYEIRRGTNWNSGIFLGFTRAVSYAMNGVAPGTHSYMLKSVDTNAKYSAGFALTSATVYGPASYTEKMSELNQFQDSTAWQASTAYSIGNRVSPSTPNGYYYECTVAGTSGGTEPTWPTANGNTVADGGATWKALEAQVFTDTEAYYDAQSGWELYAIHDSDEFGVGSKQDLKSGGDGAKRHGWNVLNSANADIINTNTTYANQLTFDCSGTDTNFSSGVFTGPFAYKLLSGDFDVETCVKDGAHNSNYEASWLIARDPAASAGEDWVGIGQQWDPSAVRLIRRDVNNSVNTEYPSASTVHPYLRITRVGNVFTLYSKALSGDVWTQREQFTRTFASTIQVGLGAMTLNTSNDYTARFDYFIVAGGSLTGTYKSPVYDRGSSVTRRSWPNFDHAFEGTGSTWQDQFDSQDLWTDALGANDTWLHLFGAFLAGTLKMKIGVSSNGTSWTWIEKFESYVIETNARYVRYEVDINDASYEGYLHTGAITYKEAYFS